MKVSVDLSEVEPTLVKAQPQKKMISVVRSEIGNHTLVQINSSSLSVLQECMRKAQYLLHEKWQSETESPSLVFGSAIHKALEVFYSGNYDERTLPAWEDVELMGYGNPSRLPEGDLLRRCFEAFIAKAQPLSMLPDTDKRSIPNGCYILWHYFKTYIDDPYVAYVDDLGPFVEREFRFTLYSDPTLTIEYFGTIDLVVRHMGTGAILVCDHKTSSVVGNDFYNRLKPNHQYTGYLLAARELYGLQTNEFFVNCVQVKERPKTARGTPPHFPRQITTRDADDFHDFRQAVVAAARSYVKALEENEFPMGHVNACAMYAGCQYLSVCAAPKVLRENILASKFIRGSKIEIKGDESATVE